MCCHISGGPRIRSAAPTICTAPAGTLRSPTCASRTRCARPSSRRRNKAAFRATTTLMGQNKKAPATSSSRRKTAAGYLKQARKRANLKVELNALATRVLFEGRRAIGIEYRQGAATRTAYADGEVILAGGAFNSPQLLQLSGVGPADLLLRHGIAVLADMPGVGSDLQDHLQVRMQFRCTEPITANDVINNWRYRYGAGIRYMLSRKGLLSVGAGYAGAFFRTRPDLATPDVQIHFLIFSTETAGAAVHPFSGFMASICQLRPDSRGTVRIKSNNPADAPAIQPRYLSERNDGDTIVAGLKRLREVMNR